MKPIEKISPITEATFYTLLALKEPLHGYGIIKRVEAISHGRMTLAAGTLYGILSNLLDLSLIILLPEGDEATRKKVYQLTDRGRDLVAFEIKRLEAILNQALVEMGDTYD